jgi:hypothetical protein
MSEKFDRFSAGALYYPYIHIKDVNWLKANLLIFPEVQRMVPFDYGFDDSHEIIPFTQWGLGETPLLRPANIFSPRSLEAQDMLASKLLEGFEDPEFLDKFGRKAARSVLSATDPGFQIHIDKLSYDLRQVLRNASLSWKPAHPDGQGYVELHPRVGQAVMSTLAVACAQADGLDIVGDERSGELHRCLVEKDLKSIYDTWLCEKTMLDAPKEATGEELMDFVLGFKVDVSKLTPQRLREIAAEREPIDKLLVALREHAAKIPAMDDGPKRHEFFMQAADKVMTEWQEDRKNLSGFGREFFGTDLTKISSDFVGKATGKLIDTAVSATSAVAAGWLGTMAKGGLFGLGAGLFVGLITHAGTSYHKISKKEKDSPYRFLTTLDKEGMVLRAGVELSR